jgi:hypothetical protein
MKTKTERILLVLNILAWISMIGYLIQCGSQLVSFVVSFINADAVEKIYGTPLHVRAVIKYNYQYFIYVISFSIALSAMHAYVWYRVVGLLKKFNLQVPFSRNVARTLEEIGIQLLGIWIVSVISQKTIAWISRNSGINIDGFHALNEYLFIAGIVYIISQVFKRGIEIQEENELTV